jgi:hypothetical protein
MIETESLMEIDMHQYTDEEIIGDGYTNASITYLHKFQKNIESEAILNQLVRDSFVRKKHQVNIPLILFSGITTILISVATTSEDNSIASSTFQVASLLASGIVTTLSSINAYYNFESRAENHNTVANRLNSLQLYISNALHLPISKRNDITTILTRIFVEKKNIDEYGKYVPVKISEKFNKAQKAI